MSLVRLACECVWRCEHARFCMKVFMRHVYIFLPSFEFGRGRRENRGGGVKRRSVRKEAKDEDRR